MLQGHRDLATVSNLILSELAPLVSAQHGAFYALVDPDDGGQPVLRFQGGYGFQERKHLASAFRLGEGLVGQCAVEKKRILLTHVPSDYIPINSGLGESPPLNIIVLPILFEGSVRAVIELASFAAFSATHQAFLDQLTESIGLVLNTVSATTVTEKLLAQAQSQAQELQSRQEQLRQSNEDLAKQATLLADQNSEIESQVPGGRGGEAAGRGEGDRAVAVLEVQVGVHRQHVARAAHAAEQPAGARRAARGQPRRQPHRPARCSTRASSARRAATCSSLLNDILDLAKVESQTVQLRARRAGAGRAGATAWSRASAPSPRRRGCGFSVDRRPDAAGDVR